MCNTSIQVSLAVVLVAALASQTDAVSYDPTCFNLSEVKEFYEDHWPSGVPRPDIDIPRDACLDYFFDSCALTFFVKLTFEGNPVLDIEIINATTVEQCTAPQGSGSVRCVTCIGIKDIYFNPGYVQACPYLVEKCTLTLPGFHRTIDSPRFNVTCPLQVGDACDRNTCGECATRSNCGWCESSQTCMARSQSGPDRCSQCNGTFALTGDDCSVDTSKQSSGMLSDSTKMALEIGLPLLFVAALAVLAIIIRGRRKSSQSPDQPKYRHSFDDEDDEVALGSMADSSDPMSSPLYDPPLNLSKGRVTRNTQPLLSSGEEVPAKKPASGDSSAATATRSQNKTAGAATVATSGDVNADADPTAKV